MSLNLLTGKSRTPEFLTDFASLEPISIPTSFLNRRWCPEPEESILHDPINWELGFKKFTTPHIIEWIISNTPETILGGLETVRSAISRKASILTPSTPLRNTILTKSSSNASKVPSRAEV